MLSQLYLKLKSTHKNEFELIKEKKLYEAFVILKEKNDPESKLMIAVIYIILGKNRDAVLKLKELETDKIFKNKDIIGEDIFYEMIGTCYFSMKNYLDAAGYYIKSLEKNDENIYSMHNLASIYIINKNYNKALVILEKLLLKEPDNEIVLKNIENLKCKLGDKKN